MSRIKDDQKDFINQQVEERLKQTLAEKNISISFEHELSGHGFSPDAIGDKNDKLKFYEHFRAKLKDMSGKTWKDFGKENKKTGYETIPFKQFSRNLQPSLKNTNIVSPNSKLDIIRVTDRYRLIGKYLSGVYYILAYDINFSAYSH